MNGGPDPRQHALQIHVTQRTHLRADGIWLWTNMLHARAHSTHSRADTITDVQAGSRSGAHAMHTWHMCTLVRCHATDAAAPRAHASGSSPAHASHNTNTYTVRGQYDMVGSRALNESRPQKVALLSRTCSHASSPERRGLRTSVMKIGRGMRVHVHMCMLQRTPQLPAL